MKTKTIILVLIAFVGCLMLAQDAPRGFRNPADVVMMTSLVSTSAPSGSTLTNDIIAFYSFDGAQASNDVAGINNYHLVDVNNISATLSAGKVGNCITNNGTVNKYFKITEASAPLLDLTNNFTISAFVNLAQYQAGEAFVSKWNTSSQRQYLMFYDGTTFNKFVGAISATGASGTNWYAYGIQPTSNTWYHTALVVSNGQSILFMNASNLYYPFTKTNVFNGNADILIGAQQDSASIMYGRVDEVGFWNRVLTSNEIYLLSVATNTFPWNP